MPASAMAAAANAKLPCKALSEKTAVLTELKSASMKLRKRKAFALTAGCI